MAAFAQLEPAPAADDTRADRRAAARPAARSSRAPSTPTSAASAARRSFRIRRVSNACCATGAPRVHAPEPDLQALYMATLTLRRMAEGGINDQLGGGFCRYSVDAHWMIPHFEKMLYDNGALLAVYAEAALATGDAALRAHRRRDRGWMHARDAVARGRLLLEPRRRLRRPRGQVLRLGPRGGARRADAGGVRGVCAALRPRPPANFEGALAPARRPLARGCRQAEQP